MSDGATVHVAECKKHNSNDDLNRNAINQVGSAFNTFEVWGKETFSKPCQNIDQWHYFHVMWTIAFYGFQYSGGQDTLSIVHLQMLVFSGTSLVHMCVYVCVGVCLSIKCVFCVFPMVWCIWT